jgi:hypothetical protein
MRKLFLLLVPLFSFAEPTDCGSLRWDYKILIDAAGLEVYKQHPHTSSIQELVTAERPTVLGNQRTEFEDQKVTVTGYVTKLGKEADRDYHLVVKSLDDEYSIVCEIPDPTCSKLKHFPGLKADYKAARNYVNQKIKLPTSQIKALTQKVKVKITGVPFFDKADHGEGHSLNGIEIHPVLQIRKI